MSIEERKIKKELETIKKTKEKQAKALLEFIDLWKEEQE